MEELRWVVVWRAVRFRMGNVKHPLNAAQLATAI